MRMRKQTPVAASVQRATVLYFARVLMFIDKRFMVIISFPAPCGLQLLLHLCLLVLMALFLVGSTQGDVINNE